MLAVGSADFRQNPVGSTGQRIRIPGLGEFDLSGESRLHSTALIASVDGFNPCRSGC